MAPSTPLSDTKFEDLIKTIKIGTFGTPDTRAGPVHSLHRYTKRSIVWLKVIKCSNIIFCIIVYLSLNSNVERRLFEKHATDLRASCISTYTQRFRSFFDL
jgi:hypothetical protein